MLVAFPAALAVSVGVSPSIVNMGEINPGSSGVGRFYLVTPGDETLLVKLDSYTFNPYNDMETNSNYSEEESKSWIYFPREMVEIIQSGQFLKTRGGSIKGWKEVTFYLNVPDNAEPGFHKFLVRPLPFMTSDDGNVIGIRAVADIPVVFTVSGIAVRHGNILDVNSGGYSDGMLGIDTFFTNTGTVTISAKVEETKIFDKNGKLLGSASSGYYKLKPGETQSLRSYVNADDIKPGEYDVFVNVSYRTGYVSKDTIITVYEKPITGYVPAVYQPPYVPIWLLIIPIIVIAYVIYRRGRS
jgi:hypothetical protein